MIRSLLLIIIFPLCLTTQAQTVDVVGRITSAQGPFTVTGRILDKKSGEALVGVNVYVEAQETGTVTDINGAFSLQFNKGRHLLKVSSVGYVTVEYPIVVLSQGSMQINLREDHLELEEVVIQATDPDANIKEVSLGRQKLSIKTIESLPPFVGEVDILKAITLLPGVSTVGEVASGFNVRGGGSDQNLILLGGAPLYNPSHFFGFFSAFNADVVSDVTVFKGGIPANYGGRGSSIVDLTYRNGDLNEWTGKASIGTVSAKITADGPLIKEKVSFLAAGRVSYSNWILNAVDETEIQNSSAQFYDVNGILRYQMNENNDFRYSFYRSSDSFNFDSDTAFAWNNQSHVLAWTHSFSDQLLLKLSLVDSRYNFSILNESGFTSFDLDSEIIDQGMKLDFTYEFNLKNTLSFGLQSKLLKIKPGSIAPGDENSAVVLLDIDDEKGLESGLYFQHDMQLGDRLGLSYGLRYSRFQYLGEKTVFDYQPFLPRTEASIIGDLNFGENEVIQEYDGFEPRVSLRYSLGKQSSIKLGFNRMNQYIHLITNTTTIAPTDVWKLSDTYLKPEIVTQYSLGFFRNFKDNAFEASLEVYYKDLENVVEYKDGAELILNDHLETELLNGEGEAYGVEFYLKKNEGPFTGWLSYTYSRSLRKVIGSYPEETINSGDWYPSNFDKPHDLTAVAEYRLNRYVKGSAIFTYSTGRPVTYPVAKFFYQGQDVAYFDSRNQDRVPNYHRLDLSFIFNFNTKHKVLQGDLVLAVYNIYGRQNAFSVYFDDVEGSPPQAYKLSVLGLPFPSISYSFDF